MKEQRSALKVKNVSEREDAFVEIACLLFLNYERISKTCKSKRSKESGSSGRHCTEHVISSESVLTMVLTTVCSTRHNRFQCTFSCYTSWCFVQRPVTVSVN